MIDGLIAGRLHGKPAIRTTKAGKPFTVAKVRVPTSDGEAVFIGALAFDAQVAAGLLALDDGDSVSLSGELRVGAWTDREGNARPSLDLIAHALLTPYHTSRKRKAQARPQPPEPQGQGWLPDEEMEF